MLGEEHTQLGKNKIGRFACRREGRERARERESERERDGENARTRTRTRMRMRTHQKDKIALFVDEHLQRPQERRLPFVPLHVHVTCMHVSTRHTYTMN